MTRVLPDPGPARMRSGPSTVETASRWCGLRPARKRSARSVVGVVVIIVIILDGYSFVLLAYRRCAAPLRGTSEFPGGDPFRHVPGGRVARTTADVGSREPSGSGTTPVLAGTTMAHCFAMMSLPFFSMSARASLVVILPAKTAWRSGVTTLSLISWPPGPSCHG